MSEGIDRRNFFGSIVKSAVKSAFHIKKEIGQVVEEIKEDIPDYSIRHEIPESLLKFEAERLKLDPEKEREKIYSILKEEMESLKA